MSINEIIELGPKGQEILDELKELRFTIESLAESCGGLDFDERFEYSLSTIEIIEKLLVNLKQK